MSGEERVVGIPQFLADARRQAEYEVEWFPDDDWPPVALALLGLLDAVETTLIENRRATTNQAWLWDKVYEALRTPPTPGGTS